MSMYFCTSKWKFSTKELSWTKENKRNRRKSSPAEVVRADIHNDLGNVRARLDTVRGARVARASHVGSKLPVQSALHWINVDTPVLRAKRRIEITLAFVQQLDNLEFVRKANGVHRDVLQKQTHHCEA